MRIVCLFIISLWLCACNGTKNTKEGGESGNGRNVTLEGEYQITSFAGQRDLPEEMLIGFNASESRAYGNAGCNNFSGTYSTDGKSLVFSKMAATRKMCLDDAVNKLEHQFLQGLENVATFKLEGDALTVADQKGGTLFTAKRPSGKDANREDAFRLEYGVSSMMKSHKTIIQGSEVWCNEGGKDYGKRKLSDEKRRVILQELQALPLEKLETLEAPSSERHMDGAAYAELFIETGGKEYKIPSFDHGNPNPAIARLVQLILDASPCK